MLNFKENLIAKMKITNFEISNIFQPVCKFEYSDQKLNEFYSFKSKIFLY